MTSEQLRAPLPPLAAIPADIQSLADYERLAPGHLTPEVWRHIEAGTGREITLAANREQFDRLQLVPRRLVGMRGASTAIDLFGRSHAAPILLAPVAYQRLAHPLGELAMVAAAVALDTTMIVSTLSSYALEEIAERGASAAAELGKTAPPPLWFQLYLQPDPSDSEALVRRAEAAGYQAIVLTVDAGAKPAGMILPPGIEAANLAGMRRETVETKLLGGSLFGTPLTDAVPTWDDVDWLRGITTLPIIVKGLLAPEDAKLAQDHGVDAVILSNHGGRVLDGLAPPLDMLPAVVTATGGTLPILMDGGVRQGSDIVKALALGAKAVLVGRPQFHALAVAGIVGAAHMLHLLRTELELAMIQTGVQNVRFLCNDHVGRRFTRDIVSF